MMLRLKNSTEDNDKLYMELLDLCGPHMIDVISAVVNSRDSLVAEFKVCIIIYFLKSFRTVTNLFRIHIRFRILFSAEFLIRIKKEIVTDPDP
jgi:hypothetical protein